MPRIIVDDGVGLEYEETGAGFPLVWCHEFAGSIESWLPQVHFFARRYRVITYNARGYPPSDVPTDPAAYSQDRAVADLYALLQHLGVGEAYVGGLSMGGTTTLNFGLQHPDVAKALIIAAAGSGSVDPESGRAGFRALADAIEADPASAFARYAEGATRLQLRRKDPLAWQEFAGLLAAHSPLGSALTMRGVQAKRPPVFALEAQMKQLDVPALILLGDEDEPCIEPSVFMKRSLPRSGLVCFPQSGHPINLEEPALFNQAVLDFLTAVEAGRWVKRED